MSKTVKIKGFVYELDWGYGDKKEYWFMSTDKSSDEYYTLIGPAEFNYTIPASFDPVASKVAELEAVKLKLKADFAKKMMEIEDSISKLTAITYEDKS